MIYLTANHRAARFLQNTLPENQGVFVLSDWIKHTLLKEGLKAGYRILTPQQSFAVWFQLIQSLDSALSQVKLAKAFMQAHAFSAHYLVPWQANRFSETADTACFFKIASQFNEWCAENKWLDVNHLFDDYLSGLPDFSVPEALCFYGFDDHLPIVKKLIEALQERGVSIHFDSPRLIPEVSAAKAGTLKEELRYVLEEAKKTLKIEPAAKIGVVITDLMQHLNLVKRLIETTGFESSEQYNLSVSLSLSGIPLIQEGLFYLNPAQREYERDELLSFLHLLGLREAESNTHALIRKIAEEGDHLIPVSVLKAWAEDLNANTVLSVFKMIESGGRFNGANHLASEWYAHWQSLLRACGWEAFFLKNAPITLQKKWREIGEAFSELDEVERLLPFVPARALFKQFLMEARIDEARHFASIQIMGELESAGLTFTHLWITGLTQAAWPREPSPHPFIPTSIQREYGLPHSSIEKETQFAKARLQNLLASAPKVTLSYHEMHDQKVLRSTPLLSGCTFKNIVLQKKEPSDNKASLSFPERLLIKKTPKRLISLLHDMAQCPFKAFVGHTLAIKPLVWFEAGVSPRLRGAILHRVLHLAWEKWQTQAYLLSLSEVALKSDLHAFLAEALRLEKDFLKLPALFQFVEKACLENTLLAWFEFEKTRLPFKVFSLEEKRTFSLGGISFDLRLDRVDETEAGAVIIDYKASNHFLKRAEFKAAPYLQLNLYALTQPKTTEAAYAVLERQALEQEAGWYSFQNEKNSHCSDLTEAQKEYEAWLVRYQSGDRAIQPFHRDACQQCEFQPVCRISNRPERDLNGH